MVRLILARISLYQHKSKRYFKCSVSVYGEKVNYLQCFSIDITEGNVEKAQDAIFEELARRQLIEYTYQGWHHYCCVNDVLYQPCIKEVGKIEFFG